MYHNLAPTSAGRYSVGIDGFKAQLSWLRAEGYTIDGFRELQRRLEQGEFPERYVVLTFDDGHKSNVVAANILREFDAQATFFLTKLVCQTRDRFMDNDEIREVSKICSVGSHGITHRPLSWLNSDEIRSELVDSKHWLEDLTGQKVEALSAPGGALDSRVVRHAREAGYGLIANSVEWWNDVPNLATTRIVNRVEVMGSLPLTRFRRVTRGNAIYLLRRRLRSAVASIPIIRSHGLRRSAGHSSVSQESGRKERQS